MKGRSGWKYVMDLFVLELYYFDFLCGSNRHYLNFLGDFYS